MAALLNQRIEAHQQVSRVLAGLGEQQLSDLMDGATQLGAGIGGTTWSLQVDGVPVFVKRVALTDRERLAQNVRSTANLFELPTWCHYGIGSAGGGAWRELATALLTSDWVTSGRSQGFALLHHWCVLDRLAPRPFTPDDRAELERHVAFWHGSPEVRERLEQLAGSSADVLLFFEYLPQQLDQWLGAQVALGTAAIDAACLMVEREIKQICAVLAANGLLHFDAHFRNILTDGERLYFADFGLADSPRFEPTEGEAKFLREHVRYDECYTLTQLVNWLFAAFDEEGPAAWMDPRRRNALIHGWAERGGPHATEVAGFPPVAVALISRYAPVAAVVNDFWFRLHVEARTIPYPAAALDRAIEVPAIG